MNLKDSPLNLNAAPEGAVYVTKRQASDMTGMSTAWFGRKMRAGELRYFRISERKCLFLRDDILALVTVTEKGA